MERKTLKGIAFVAMMIAALLPASAGPASAYLYSWTPAQMITDPVNDAPYTPTPGQNILSGYHAYDGTYHYFRIDLASAPAYANPPGYANTYGIYIDSISVFGAPNSDRYVPGTLSGIDYIVSAELEFEGKKHVLDWDPELQRWKDVIFEDSGNLMFLASGGGQTLEWRIKEEGNFVIGNSFTWWAATMHPGDHDGSGKQTYDVMATPIPASAWLLATGVIGLIGLKRRKRKAA